MGRALATTPHKHDVRETSTVMLLLTTATVMPTATSVDLAMVLATAMALLVPLAR